MCALQSFAVSLMMLRIGFVLAKDETFSDSPAELCH